MYFLETRDGHKFPVSEYEPTCDDAIKLRIMKKLDFEWFTGHLARFEVTVWDNDEVKCILKGCYTEMDLREYERGNFSTLLGKSLTLPHQNSSTATSRAIGHGSKKAGTKPGLLICSRFVLR